MVLFLYLFLTAIVKTVLSFTCYCDEMTPGCSYNKCNVAENGYCHITVINSTVHAECMHKNESVFDTFGCMSKDNVTIYDQRTQKLNFCCKTFAECNKCPPTIAWTYFPNLNSYVRTECVFLSSTPLLTATVVSSVVVQSPFNHPSNKNMSMNTTEYTIFIIMFALIGVATVISGCVMAGFIVYCIKSHWRPKPNLSIHIPDSVSSSGCSSSGNGPRILQPRSISNDITKIHVLGRGRFGEVWLANYSGEEVAVKVFKTFYEIAWNREVSIYNTYMLHHQNILRFIGSDRVTLRNDIELWTVSQYHENGTLYEFLIKMSSLSFKQCHIMALSLANGLQYLHRPINAGNKKPGIAHRDLKSRNILVQKDYTLCIADLGLAVKQADYGNGVDLVPTNKLSGTRRYLSPEILNETMDFTVFISYTRSDIYSLSLILWEIFNVCNVNGIAQQHLLPYEGFVSSDPDLQQMKNTVVTNGIRPPLPDSWKNNDDFVFIERILTESWSFFPQSRPTALHILKKLQNIQVKQSLS